jgi:hypothetical protein
MQVAKRKKRNRRVNPDDLHPDVAAGLAQGEEEIEADRLNFHRTPAGVDVVRHMRDVELVLGSRVPLPKFVAEESSSDLVTEFADGRRFHDVRKVFDPDTVRAFQSGMLCLKCLEPQAVPFGDDHLPGCEGVALAGEHYMRDRQILDFAAEFEGTHHIGPSRPISQFLAEQTERRERREFEQRIAEGRSRGRRARAS